MSKSFVLITVALSILAMPTYLAAQSMPQAPMGGPPPIATRSSPEQELKHLAKSLKLSEEQKEQVLPLLQERVEAIEKLIADQETSMRDKFPKMLAIRDGTNERIRVLLTDPQKKKFDRVLADEKRRQESGPDDGPMDSPPPGDAPPPQ